MKRLSIAFLAGMSLASFGCGKKGGGGGGDLMGQSVAMKEAMCKCKDKTCADKVTADGQKAALEMTKGMSEEDVKKMSDGISAEDKKKMDDLEVEETKCMTAAMGGAATGGDKAPAGDKPAAAGGDIPQDCVDYKAAMEKLSTCDKLPQATRDAMKQGYDSISQGWPNAAGLPAEAKKAMADGCKQGADAMMQSGKALCGW